MTDTAEWLRMYARQLEDQHAPSNLSIGMREAANQMDQQRETTLQLLGQVGQLSDEIEKLRAALEAAADRMFDAGLNDAWAEARTALEGK